MKPEHCHAASGSAAAGASAIDDACQVSIDRLCCIVLLSIAAACTVFLNVLVHLPRPHAFRSAYLPHLRLVRHLQVLARSGVAGDASRGAVLYLLQRQLLRQRSLRAEGRDHAGVAQAEAEV